MAVVGKTRIIDIAEILKVKFQDLRDKHIVDEVIRPQTGLRSFPEWRSEQRILSDLLVANINDQIANYRLGLDMLLVGIDDEAHLIRISDPGAYRSYDSLSYCCIGMGDRHADNVFAWYRYMRELSRNEALYIAFEAKKKAELAGGVGQSTDVLIINVDGIRKVEESTVQDLEEIYESREAQGDRAKFDERITEIEIKTEQIGA